jgi:hypothetical protein
MYNFGPIKLALGFDYKNNWIIHIHMHQFFLNVQGDDFGWCILQKCTYQA